MVSEHFSAYRMGNNEENVPKLDASARVLTWFVFQASINACKLLSSQNYTKNIDTFQEGVLTPTQVSSGVILNKSCCQSLSTSCPSD